MAKFKFKIDDGTRVKSVGTIFQFKVRTPGMTLHNMRLQTGAADHAKPYPNIHLSYAKGTNGPNSFGVTFPEGVSETIRLAAIVALADWTAEHGQKYPPELLTASERMKWLNEWRESTRLSSSGYIEVEDSDYDTNVLNPEEA